VKQLLVLLCDNLLNITKSQEIATRHCPFLAASTECSAGSNDHFVVVVVPSLVQFDRRPLGGANFQY
jgi:hypothetical protein